MRRCLYPFLVLASPAFADAPQVVEARVIPMDGVWTIEVTLRHADTGWDHYADGWGVYLEDGTELGYRSLQHPHVDEQPFTRRLRQVEIPQAVSSVRIIPRDTVHGTGAAFTLDLD